MDLLKLRRDMQAKRPRFVRQALHKKRLDAVWRRPKGVDSKLRKRKKGRGAWVQPGYGSPAAVRGMDRSGKLPFRVSSPDQLSSLDARIHGVVIAHGVGLMKSKLIIDAATKRGIHVLNGSAAALAKQVDEIASLRKARRQSIMKRRSAKQPETKEAKSVEKQISSEEKAAIEKVEKDKVLTKRGP